MRSLGKIGSDAVEGTVRGAWWGAVGGGLCVLGGFFTGGATWAALPAVLSAAGGAAVAGAKLGAGVGAIMGAAGQNDKMSEIAQEIGKRVTQ